MPAVAGLPSLSELLAWPTEHLTEAADYWETIGGRCFEVAHQVWCDAMSIDWEGEAADALRAGTHADLLTTGAADDQLHDAAKVARSGASDLYAARSRLRYAVDDARTAGFAVSEDISVTDRLNSRSAIQRAARQAQAQTFAGDIRQRAVQLVNLDQQVADNVTAAVAGIRDAFPQQPTPNDPPPKPEIHAVDNHWKQDPPPPGPDTDRPWENQPPPRTLDEVRDTLRQLRRGKNEPHRELDTPEEIRKFYEWLTKGAVGEVPPFGFPRRMLEDGTVIEMHPDSRSGGPAIEVKAPGAKKGPKVHLPLPIVDEPPELSGIGEHPPTKLPPLPAPHPPPTIVPPTQFADPADLPSWLRNPSPPGFSVCPVQQPPVFEWDRPDAPTVSQPAAPPPVGSSWLPEIGHDLGEAGKKTFEWLVIGGIVVGGLLSAGGPGRQVPTP
jgi:hypothetical protein